MKDRWSWKIPAREKRGTYLILALASFLIPVRWFIASKEEAPSAYWLQVDQWLDSLESVGHLSTEISETPNKDFKINPAFASVEDLQKAGFPTFLAKRVVDYREKGGKINSELDLRKLYGMTDSLLERVTPHLRFSGKEDFVQMVYKNEKKGTIFSELTIDLNQADSMELLKLNGIGPVLSARIIKYREKLGGFYSKDQLLEVYGIDSLILKKNPGVQVGDHPLRRISLKKVTFRELKAHPYVDYKTTKKIFQARKEGKISGPDDLVKEGLLSPDLYSKLAPYLME